MMGAQDQSTRRPRSLKLITNFITATISRHIIARVRSRLSSAQQVWLALVGVQRAQRRGLLVGAELDHVRYAPLHVGILSKALNFVP